jgi:2-desacetyl-2-hydroxyethyl bacteriochlorophyllide A dehydrogenase
LKEDNDMKAICIENPQEICKKDIASPVRTDGTALIKVKSMSICGSDVSAYRYKHPLCNYPLIIGHEIAGTIEEIDDNSKGLMVNDRVILDPYLFCGTCYPCIQGRTNCCESLKVLGVQTDGAMCEYFVHPVSHLVKVPDNIPWEQIPLAEPLTIALHAIHRVEPVSGEHVTIIGAGAIGIMAALAAKIYGATPILVDVVDGRLATAKGCGVENVINAATEDAEAIISNLTSGRMSETVIEASGADQGIANALLYAAYTGRIAFTGWPKGDVLLPTALITKKELKIVGSRTSVNEFDEALSIISQGKMDMTKFISQVVDFDEIPEAVRLLDKAPGDYLKVVGLFK